MDFLEFMGKPKHPKRRKCSYQNRSNTRHIEIEEKDSIEIKNNKVSFEQVKKTVIYNKDSKNKGMKRVRPNQKNSLKFHIDTKRSKSALSTSRKRDSSVNSNREISSFIDCKHKRQEVKNSKQLRKAKKE